jgi:molecular chaperone DnaK
MARIVGIDLGTTNSLAACMDAGGRPEIVPNAAGSRLTPSVVGLDRTGRLHVGETARNQLVGMPERTVAEVKRLMGSGTAVRLGDRSYTPQEISALILRSLREDAERHLGEPVEEAVVTVPAYFTDAQRQATRDAGELAGLRVDRILNEPTAAALAYGLDHLDAEQHVVVFDLGGGTLDVSVLEMFQGVLEVKASAGNSRLGGGDFDRAVTAWLCNELQRAHGVDVRGDLRTMARLRQAAEQAKVALSSLDSVPVVLPFVAQRAGQPVSLEVELTRERLEELVGDLARSALEPLQVALLDARLAREAITDLVLVGGASRVPLVRRLVSEFFGKAPRAGVHPDEAIALGAAVQAGLKSGALPRASGIMITDVCPFTLGVEVSSEPGSRPGTGRFSPVMPRNTTIPASRTEIYQTTTAGQAQVEIRVYQGESPWVKDNVLLDRYVVGGVPPAPAGVEQVAVTFSCDLNGIVHVTTKILSTGGEASLVVDRNRQRLTGAERLEARARLDADCGPAPAPRPGPARLPLAETARARALLSGPGDREKLLFLASELERASAAGHDEEAGRLERELTSLLTSGTALA